MSVFPQYHRPQPLRIRQGVFCRNAKVIAIRTAKVLTRIAMLPSHSRKGGCAQVQSKFVDSVMVVLQIGKSPQVSSMSLMGSLIKRSLQEVSSSKSPCIPVGEGTR